MSVRWCLIVGLVGFLGLGCATTAEGGDVAAVEAPISTPPAAGPDAACAELPERYGLERHLPLEAGLAAKGSGGLFFGRALFCLDGATPTTKRMGNIGMPAGYEPRGKLILDPELAVDSWSVKCPDRKSVTLYVNMYRIGPRCAPPGFRFTPVKAQDAHARAGALLKEGKNAEALAAMDEAISVVDDIVAYHHRRAVTLLKLGRFAESEAVFRHAISWSTPGIYLRLHLGLSLLRQGKREPYSVIVRGLRDDLGKDHALRPELDCRHAFNEHHADRTATVIELAASACKGGYKACCTFPPEE